MTALTDLTKRKLKIYPGTPGRVHTVRKFTAGGLHLDYSAAPPRGVAMCSKV